MNAIRTNAIRTMVSVVMPVLLIACGESEEVIKQRTAARNAMQSLRKIVAATQVKPTYEQYNQLVIDAKAQVNEAVAALQDNKFNELKKELNAAMDAYVDAGTAWKASDRAVLSNEREPGKNLNSKYNLGIGNNVAASAIEINQELNKIGDPNAENKQQKEVLGKI